MTGASRQAWKELGRYGGIGVELVVTILLLGWLGRWLDERYWGGHGWGMAAGFVLGVAVAVRNLLRTAARMQRDIERAEANDPEAGRWRVDEAWLHKDGPSSGRSSEPGAEGRSGDADERPS
ncbi:MAG: AtpZ/AtpI family protein [Myxococcales bacterium]|nr:AtpZ/AtpI family protein [Myxococcales bacterium]